MVPSECVRCGEMFIGTHEECPPCLVRKLRQELAEARGIVEEIERQLQAAEKAAGCRPGDGSDQPGLFEVAVPGLFG